MFCCEEELEALHHFATLAGIISQDEDVDMNIIESPLPVVGYMGINESTPPDAVHSYSYSSDLPICPDTPRKKPRLMIGDEDDRVYGFHTTGGLPYFPFDGFDRVDFEESTLISPRRIAFDTGTLDIVEPALVPSVLPTLPNVIEPERRQPVEAEQEREEDGQSMSRSDEDSDIRIT
jgi:hypothetical protein